MRKRAIGFGLGQRGDLVISTVVARAFKESHPDWHLILGVGPQYADMIPLFYQHPYFDSFHVYEGYAEWPTQGDREYLQRARYDLVFNGMPQVPEGWWLRGHQTDTMCAVHGLPRPSNHQCVLTQWFRVENHGKRAVAIAPFAGFAPGRTNDKALPFPLAQAIVTHLVDADWTVFQLGGPDEPHLDGAIQPKGQSYFESVRTMLGCQALIHSDTGLGWVASAYSLPCFGLYAARYYGLDHVSAIQPVNRSPVCYLAADLISDHTVETVVPALDQFLQAL